MTYSISSSLHYQAHVSMSPDCHMITTCCTQTVTIGLIEGIQQLDNKTRVNSTHGDVDLAV